MKSFLEKAEILFILIGCFFAFGCVTTSNLPITDGILNEIGGINNANKFQYYVSKTITLTLVDSRSSTNIESGQLRRESSTARSTIIIKENLPGIVLGQGRQVNDDLNPTLDVAFEEYGGGYPTLSFGKYRVGAQERYYLLYDEPNNSIIVYGNNRYRVNFDRTTPHSGQPYLLIKESQRSRSSSRTRNAKGLTL